jgi:hypothetical protein
MIIIGNSLQIKEEPVDVRALWCHQLWKVWSSKYYFFNY